MSCTEALKGAHLVDFTGTCEGFTKMTSFGQPIVDLIRKGEAKAIVLIDRATGMRHQRPVVVRDHLNLTGSNPLVGPNPEGGPRFPVVQGIYITDHMKGLDSGVAGGLKAGVEPTGEDVQLLRNFGVDFCSYNIVPTMLVAAHKGMKVLAIGLPDGQTLSKEHMAEILELTGAKK